MTDFHNIYGEPIDVNAAQTANRRACMRGEAPPRRTPTIKKGYAAIPGTGPACKTCRDCKHKRSISNTGNKTWIKCELRRSTWTHGEGTDIRASSPACSKFEAREARKS